MKLPPKSLLLLPLAILTLFNCEELIDFAPPEIEIIEPEEGVSYFNTLPVELQVTDNRKVEKVEVFLDDASVHEFTREPYKTEIDMAGISAKALKIVAHDRVGNWSESERRASFTEETVSTPYTPSGSDSGYINRTYMYSTDGSTSNAGHSIEYRFDWGESIYSSWSASTSTPHFWSSAGTYSIRAQARCATDTVVVSSWSDSKTITITIWRPALIGSYDTPGYAFQVFVSDIYTYVANPLGGLQIINVSNPLSPTMAGTYDTPGDDTYDVFISTNYAYVAGYSHGMQIIDVSNPTSPTRVGYYDTPGLAGSVFVLGSYAYVADGESGLQIIDISSPSSPTLVGSYDTSGEAFGVFVSGGYAYMADRSSGLQIIDVSNQSVPTLTGSFGMQGDALYLFVSGNYAYVTEQDAGRLQIIDVSSPANPTLAGSYDTPGRARGVFISGDYAYVGQGNGLQIINVSNPTSPTLTGSYDTTDSVQDVFVSGNYAYVTNRYNGLLIFDISGLP